MIDRVGSPSPHWPPTRIVIRATNWLGDGVMSMPAVEHVRAAFPAAYIAILARPDVADLYRGGHADEVILWTPRQARRDLLGRMRLAARLRSMRFDAAILLQNAFDAALVAWLARIPVRIGYAVKGRGRLLTHPIAVPAPGSVPEHQSFYYLELLRKSGIIDALPARVQPRLRSPQRICEFRGIALSGRWVGVAPGASNGSAKRWLPERFAEAAADAARTLRARVMVLGSVQDREVCARAATGIRQRGVDAVDVSGATDVTTLVALTARCTVVVANDSGSMHIADALGVPTVAVFGPTCERSTGPTGLLSRVVREPVTCSPCLLHECPIDHRCMMRVPARRVAAAVAEVVRAADAARPDAGATP